MAFYFLSVLKAIFTCNHTRVSGGEGKTYCPDCGCGILIRWVVLRCKGCGQRRASQYRLRRPVPQEACCVFCGESAIYTEYLENPAYFQIRYAVLQLQAEPTIPNTFWVHATAWVKSQTALYPFDYHRPLLMTS